MLMMYETYIITVAFLQLGADISHMLVDLGKGSSRDVKRRALSHKLTQWPGVKH